MIHHIYIFVSISIISYLYSTYISFHFIVVGTLVGAFPCGAMLLASFLLSQLDVEPYVEAVFQNFAAGLILAAVGAELFPLLHKYSTTEESIIGISIGFPAALMILYGIEYIIDGLSGELMKVFILCVFFHSIDINFISLMFYPFFLFCSFALYVHVPHINPW